ncbi:MAG: DUF72 domain-containing protein [Bacteroidota bacterium]
MNKAGTSFSIGIGGWEHDVLDRCFYPSPQAGLLEKLAYYSKVFDTVEVRATFWDDALTGEDAKKWIQAVRENRRFTFNVKLHASFTHKKSIRPQVTRSVRSLLHELLKADRLGTLLIQFPYSFTNTSTNRFHLVKLAEGFAGYPMHVEFRHESWNQPSTWDLLAEKSLSLTSPDLPHIRQFMPYTSSIVGDRAYLRLHGRNEKGWLLNSLDARYDYLYNGKEIREIVRRVEAISHKSRHVTIIFNNTTGGKAVANALQFVSALRAGKHVLVPEATLRTFPHLHEIASVVQPGLGLIVNAGYRQAI